MNSGLDKRNLGCIFVCAFPFLKLVPAKKGIFSFLAVFYHKENSVSNFTCERRIWVVWGSSFTQILVDVGLGKRARNWLPLHVLAKSESLCGVPSY